MDQNKTPPEKLLHLGKWYATGDKANKKLFLSLLIRNGFLSFNGRHTAKKILNEEAIIKHVDVNHEGTRGNYFLASGSSEQSTKGLMHFDLNQLDVYWTLAYILEPDNR